MNGKFISKKNIFREIFDNFFYLDYDLEKSMSLMKLLFQKYELNDINNIRFENDMLFIEVCNIKMLTFAKLIYNFSIDNDNEINIEIQDNYSEEDLINNVQEMHDNY